MIVVRILTRMTDRDTPPDLGGDLADDLAGLLRAPRYRPGPPCGVRLAIRRVSEADPRAGEVLTALIDNPEVSATLISEKLRARGLQVSGQSLARHRRRGQHNGCRCEA